MKLTPTPIAGVMVAETSYACDARGSFGRLFCEDELAPVLGMRRIVQMNHSLTASKATVRGMHFQHPPHAEMKLVRCLKGRIWDVAVDLRKDSPTFLQWHAEELSPANAKMLIVPEGCAHGFQTLEDACEMLYLHTARYAPNAEGGVRHDDARLSIQWPLPPIGLSDRDKSYPSLEHFAGIAL